MYLKVFHKKKKKINWSVQSRYMGTVCYWWQMVAYSLFSGGISRFCLFNWMLSREMSLMWIKNNYFTLCNSKCLLLLLSLFTLLYLFSRLCTSLNTSVVHLPPIHRVNLQQQSKSLSNTYGRTMRFRSILVTVHYWMLFKTLRATISASW